MKISNFFYFLSFFYFFSIEMMNERIFSFFRSLFWTKSAYILPAFLISNYFFFKEKEKIVKKIVKKIINEENNIKKKMIVSSSNHEHDKIKTVFTVFIERELIREANYKKYKNQFLYFNQLLGNSFLSYISSFLHISKFSYPNVLKSYAKLYIDYQRKIKLNCYSDNINNDLINNIQIKELINLFILSFYFYPNKKIFGNGISKLHKRLFFFALQSNLCINFFIKILQKNYGNFLVKLSLMNDNEEIEGLKKYYENLQDREKNFNNKIEIEKNKLRENIFFQNLLLIPGLHQFSLLYYSFKNNPSHLICLPAFLFLSLSNHLLRYSVFPYFLKNFSHKNLFHIPFFFIDFYILFCYYLEFKILRRKILRRREEEENHLNPGESRTEYYQDKMITFACDDDGKITQTTSYYST